MTSCKKGLLKNFAKFTGKHLQWSPFSCRFASLGSFYHKKDLVAGVSLSILRNSRIININNFEQHGWLLLQEEKIPFLVFHIYNFSLPNYLSFKLLVSLISFTNKFIFCFANNCFFYLEAHFNNS